MTEPVWLSLRTLGAFQVRLARLHWTTPGVRDLALLESALARPQQRQAYDPESTLFDLAAACAFGISQNHPFHDGNKRMTLVALDVFLLENGYQLVASEPEAYTTIMKLADGEIKETYLADWVQRNSVKNR